MGPVLRNVMEDFLPRRGHTVMGAIELALRLAVLWLSARLALEFFTTVWVRLGYPFELEWMEGTVMDHVARVRAGVPIYVRPSAEFVPYLYPPLFYWCSAAMSYVVGMQLLAPRLVSTLAWVVLVVTMADFVRRETGCWWAGWLSAALYTLTYGSVGYWFDLARVDGLMLALVFLGSWVARFRHGLVSAVLAGLVLGAAFFAKQQALALVSAPLIYALLASWRRGAIMVATFASVVLVGVVALDARTAGWFSYYVFSLPRQHSWGWGGWKEHLEPFWGPMAPHVVLAIVALAVPVTATRRFATTAFYFVLGVAAPVASYLSLLHTDGWINVLMPAYAVFSMLAGVLIGWLRSCPESMARRGLVAAHVLILLAFAMLPNDWAAQRPTAEDRVAGWRAIEKYRAIQGRIYAPSTGHYARLAGHEELSAQDMALRDVMKTHDRELRRELLDNVRRGYREQRYAAVILGATWDVVPIELKHELWRYYRRVGRVFEDEHCRPTTGLRVRPETIWVPRKKPMKGPPPDVPRRGRGKRRPRKTKGR